MRRKALFYGWWVLIACAAVQLYFNATSVTGFTAFFNPLVNEFGWSYASVSLAMTFRSLELVFLAPIVGFLVDRFRPRKVLFVSVVLGAAGFLFFSHIQALWSFYVAVVVIGLSLVLSSNIVVMTPVALWFKERTSRAMGVLTAGTAVGGMLVPAIVWFIDKLGWRTALAYFAAGALVICIPFCFVIRDPPNEDYPVQKSESSPGTRQVEEKVQIREVLKKKHFWALSLAVLFSALAYSALTAHQIPYLISVGMGRDTAGWMVLVYSVSGIIGRLGFGWLGDSIDKKLCFVLSAIIQAGGLVAFNYSSSVTQVLPSLLVLGIGTGGFWPLRPALQIEFFGVKGFAIIQSLVMLSQVMSGMIAPPFAGWVFDSYQSYQPAWITFAVCSLITVPIILSVSKKRDAHDVG